MSHLTKVDCKINSVETLQTTLEEMGYELVPDAKISSRWWKSRNVDLGVKKNSKLLPLGWIKQPDSTYEMIADWYGTGINQIKFVEQIKVGYTKHKASSWLKSKGYSVKYEYDTEGDLVVVGSRW